MRTTLICTILTIGLWPAAAQEASAEAALPSLEACGASTGEGEYLTCIERLNAELDTLTATALQRLEEDADAFGEDEAEVYRTAVQRLARGAAEAQGGWCEVSTFESRTGTGFGSIHAACLFEEKLAFLEKINNFNAMP